MKKITIYLILIISTSMIAQSGLTDWDKTYPFKEPLKIIDEEVEYANLTEKDTLEAQYYVAASKYRFVVEFTGNERDINKETMKSMANVILIKFGRKDFINYQNVNSEFEFISNGRKIWMPIQSALKSDFKNEVKKGSKVLLYALFLNEHTQKKELNNIFYISEFTTNWE